MGNETPPRREETGTYRVITIEGTGERANFIRLSRKLLMGSRLFPYMLEKMRKNGSLASIYKKTYHRYKELHREMKAHYRAYTLEANRLFKKQDLQIKKLEREKRKFMEEKRLMQQRWGAEKSRRQQLGKRNNQLLKQVNFIKSFEGFVTKHFSWNNTLQDHAKCEVILRTILGYEQFKRKGETNYHELCLLAVGMQFDAFNGTVVKRRFGDAFGNRFQSEMDKLIEKGYMKKFYRKNLYYITDDGRNQIKKILSLIYSAQYGYYWKRLLDKKD
jgi:hypothetical protein